MCARLKSVTYRALLVVNEIGYLPIGRTGTMLFFQLILMTRRGAVYSRVYARRGSLRNQQRVERGPCPTGDRQKRREIDAGWLIHAG